MFENIRPLYDSELADALRKIISSPLFGPLARFVYPHEIPDNVGNRLCGIDCIHTLQDTIMRDALLRILDCSVSSFTFSGVESLTPGQPYLFISNHRDITLDAFLLQYLLFDYNDLYITFGANLMQDPVVTLIGRANRMFRVERGGTPKEYYRNMLQVSSYIRHIIVGQKNSVWIAQRNGRTKDGIDRTKVSLLKMLALSGRATRNDQLAPLKDLNIVPVSISYEWEPCDLLKAHELYLRSQGPYSKSRDEDMNSVLTGLMQPKGHVHLSITTPLSSEELASCSYTDSPFENLASLIDRRIIDAYSIHPTNYVAYDIKHNTDSFADKYTNELRERFLARLSNVDAAERNIMLDIYASPVDSLRFHN